MRKIVSGRIGTFLARSWYPYVFDDTILPCRVTNATMPDSAPSSTYFFNERSSAARRSPENPASFGAAAGSSPDCAKTRIGAVSGRTSRIDRRRKGPRRMSMAAQILRQSKFGPMQCRIRRFAEGFLTITNPLTLVLVEDDDDVRVALARLLRAMGHTHIVIVLDEDKGQRVGDGQKTLRESRLEE